MSDGMSPLPNSQGPQGTGHYRADDDIELPPLAEAEALKGDADQQLRPIGAPAKQTARISSVLGGVALVGALLFGGWFYFGGDSAEKQHENWQHVAAAARASTDDVQQLIQVDPSGNSSASAALGVSSADINRAGMQQIRVALLRNDLVSASAALQAAQNMPSPSSNPDVRLPSVDAEMATEIKEGRKELYQIELFDC